MAQRSRLRGRSAKPLCPRPTDPVFSPRAPDPITCRETKLTTSSLGVFTFTLRAAPHREATVSFSTLFAWDRAGVRRDSFQNDFPTNTNILSNPTASGEPRKSKMRRPRRRQRPPVRDQSTSFNTYSDVNSATLGREAHASIKCPSGVGFNALGGDMYLQASPSAPTTDRLETGSRSLCASALAAPMDGWLQATTQAPSQSIAGLVVIFPILESATSTKRSPLYSLEADQHPSLPPRAT